MQKITAYKLETTGNHYIILIDPNLVSPDETSALRYELRAQGVSATIMFVAPKHSALNIVSVTPIDIGKED